MGGAVGRGRGRGGRARLALASAVAAATALAPVLGVVVAVAGATAAWPAPAAAAARATGPYADVPANFWDAGRIVAAVRAGYVAPLGAYFRPTWAFTEGDLAHALSRLPAGPAPARAQAIVAAAVAASGASYAPGATASHAVFALALVQALGLAQGAADLAAVSSPWPDGAFIPAWARGAATLMARLGITWGNTWAGTFQATGGVERDQAAWALVGAASLDAGAVARALAPAVAAVRIEGAPTTLAVGQRVPVHAEVLDRGGHPLPVGVAWQATGGVGLGSGEVVYGARPGAGELTARALAGGASATVRIQVSGAAAAGGGGGGGGGTGTGGGAGTGGGTGSGGGAGAGSGAGSATGTGGAGGAAGATSGGAGESGAKAGPFPDVPASYWAAAAIRTAAARGYLPPLAGGDWAPASPLREIGLARALAAWKGVSPGAGEALVARALGRYEPYARVDRAQLAEAIDAALSLSLVALDEATLAPVWPDTASLPPPARGGVTLFGHLGLGLGDLVGGRFQPALPVTRAEAAYALVAAAALPVGALEREASRVVRSVTTPVPVSAPVLAGTAVALTAQALDAQGRPVPSLLAWSASDGTVSPDGVFTARAPGTAVVTAVAPLSGARASARLAVAPAPPPPPTALAVHAPASAPAGQSLTVRVEADDAHGLDAADSGRSIVLSVTGPQGTTSLTATDRAGVAVFTFLPTAAGTYVLSASSQGLTGASARTAVTDPASQAAQLAVALVSPQTPQEGAATTIRVTVQTAAGAIATADGGRTITLTLSLAQGLLPAAAPPGAPATTQAPVVLQAQDQGGVATFDWTAGLPGTYSVTATAQGLTGASVGVTVAPAPVAGLVLSATSTTVLAGTTVPIAATLVDAGGQPTVGTVPLSVGLGAGSSGSLKVTAASLTDSAVVAQFTAPAGAAASAAVIAATPGLAPAELTLNVVTSLPQDVPSFAGAPYSATAGQSVNVIVDVGPAPGQPDTASNGVPVTLTVTAPGGSTGQTLTAADSAGVASFPLTETVAGVYQLSAQIAGATAQATTLTVQPGAPAALTLSASPSSLLLPGQTATLSVAVADAYGNPEPAAAAVPVSLSASPATLGTLSATAAIAPGTVGQFTATAPGTVTLTATSPGLKAASLTIVIETTRAALVSGKGMWLMWSDWHTVGAQQIVATCLADHIDHLYLEVATTHDGFYGTDALNALLPVAHAAHIVVVAWVYTALVNPAADAAMTVQVAQYTTPGGARVDGVAADIEDVMTAKAVGAYAAAVRQALPDELFVGVTYPPMYHTSYPYATLAQYVDAIAPMDYWHSIPEAYSASDVYSYIRQSIDMIRQLDHDPSLPIAPIGQAYDMFTDTGTGPNNPTPAEIAAAFQAAESDGAIGFSLYRWGTATASEWKTWAGLVWGAPAGQGGSA
jgi:hypothetical protein